MLCHAVLLAAFVPTDWSVSPGESIQVAIDLASDGDRILVEPGTYMETLNLRGKLLEVIGVAGAANTILDAQGSGGPAVMAVSGEPAGTCIRDFTIKNGQGLETQFLLGGGVCVVGGYQASTTLEVDGCIIEGITGPCALSSWGYPTLLSLKDCIVRNCSLDYFGGSVVLSEDLGTVDLERCILTNNGGQYSNATSGHPSGAISIDDSIIWNTGVVAGAGSVRYSDIQGGYPGEGNIDADPRFVDPAHGDYSLLLGSPCINSGDPSAPVDADGTRADIGPNEFDHTTDGVPFVYCLAADVSCPCENPGTLDSGCDNAQGTGGVRLLLSGYSPDMNGGGEVALVGLDFPLDNQVTVVAVRSSHQEPVPLAFGDGLRCVGTNGLTRVKAGVASLAVFVGAIDHGAGTGTFFYQLWYRSQPMSYCNPLAAFNLSNAVAIPWP